MRPIADDNRRIVFCDVVKKRKKKMPKELYRLVSALVLILLSTATAFAFGGGGGPAAAAPNPAVSAGSIRYPESRVSLPITPIGLRHSRSRWRAVATSA